MILFEIFLVNAIHDLQNINNPERIRLELLRHVICQLSCINNKTSELQAIRELTQLNQQT